MLPYKYAYLFGSLLFLAYWLVIYFSWPKHRQQLLLYSFIFAFLGPVASAVWFTKDWWQPATILGMRTGIEDILFGFANGGLAATLYLFFYREKSRQAPKNMILGHVPLLAIILITTILFVVFKLPSFWANCLGTLTGIIIILISRPDLFKIAGLSAILILAASLPVYWLTIAAFPGWVEHTWFNDRLSKVSFTGIPIEDIAWYPLIGAAISLMYPYYKGIYYQFKFKN